MRYKNVDTSFFRYVTMHAFDREIDRRTERPCNTVRCIRLHAAAR